MVTHGGLFTTDGVKLSDIEGINRYQEPSEEGGLMSDLLWSDPQPFPGRAPSKRGVGQSFGPDITRAFLEGNDLALLIRSHEVKDEGYVVEHGGKCITVFSAPNYCDTIGNKGAVCVLNHKDLGTPTFLQFTAVPHPPIRPSESPPRDFPPFALFALFISFSPSHSPILPPHPPPPFFEQWLTAVAMHLSLGCSQHTRTLSRTHAHLLTHPRVGKKVGGVFGFWFRYCRAISSPL